MSGTENPSSPFAPLQADLQRMRKSNLHAAINDVDGIIALLEEARRTVAEESEAHKISMAMTRLQNPVKEKFDAITNDLKDVTKAQKGFGKNLDKAMPPKDLPMEFDAMAQQQKNVSRAIGMHLLREGQFTVASTFVEEARALAVDENAKEPFADNDPDGDKDMVDDASAAASAADDARSKEDLQNQFAEMYEILAQLKVSNLLPAIEWARLNGEKLEARGSNLEFELSKLQFLWLFSGGKGNNDDDDASDDTKTGYIRAYQYGRQHFGHFQRRHLKEIAQLSAAMIYAPNISSSPYRHLFQTSAAFDEVSVSFTREFCSLLGLAAESPLYIAVTAGSIALPRLLKYTTYMREKKTEWTTENELAFETPLPASMIYHPIFVCPVSKEQTTEQNPPVMLICGHVISQESLHNMAKSTRYKCPYCPQEGAVADTRRIYL